MTGDQFELRAGRPVIVPGAPIQRLTSHLRPLLPCGHDSLGTHGVATVTSRCGGPQLPGLSRSAARTNCDRWEEAAT